MNTYNIHINILLSFTTISNYIFFLWNIFYGVQYDIIFEYIILKIRNQSILSILMKYEIMERCADCLPFFKVMYTKRSHVCSISLLNTIVNYPQIIFSEAFLDFRQTGKGMICRNVLRKNLLN